MRIGGVAAALISPAVMVKPNGSRPAFDNADKRFAESPNTT